ncbi:hypothetical protein [Actinoplanes sp. NPDC026623]|uniref:hypothetical protein n=1 Tax=Actinoplanes sp. NPDC026623 TaxID=3155610 RepID=UPI0033D70B44
MSRAARLPKTWGDPEHALIVPTACGGFLLFIKFSNTGRRRTGVDLGTRWDDYDVPDDREITAAAEGLARLGLTLTAPWTPGSERYSLTAPVALAPRTPHLFARWITALRVRKAGTR